MFIHGMDTVVNVLVCVCYQIIVSTNFSTLEDSGLNPSEAFFFSFSFCLFVCFFMNGQFRQGICTASALIIPCHVYTWEGYCSQHVSVCVTS